MTEHPLTDVYTRENCQLCGGCARLADDLCPRCNGTGRQVRAAFSPGSAIGGPDDEDMEIHRLRTLLSELEAARG